MQEEIEHIELKAKETEIITNVHADGGQMEET